MQFPPEAGSDGGFEAVREKVKEKLLSDLTNQKLSEIAKFAGDQLLAKLLPLRRDDIYYALPEDWNQRDLAFPTLAESIANEFNVAVPSYRSTGEEWMTETQLGELAGIGQATSDKFGPQPVPFTRLISLARELDGSPTIPIQKSVAGPPMKSADGSIHFFRILDVDPSHAPKSVDEVRDQLVQDIRTVKRFEELKASAESIRMQAMQDGFVSLAAANSTTVEAVSRVSPVGNVDFRRRAGRSFPVFLGSLGQVPDTVREIAKRRRRAAANHEDDRDSRKRSNVRTPS